jgi:hypothetical protein
MIDPRNGNDEGGALAGAIVAGARRPGCEVLDVAEGGELALALIEQG